MSHGLQNTYKEHGCRCEYCAAANRIENRTGTTKPADRKAIRHAALTGAPVPEFALSKRVGRSSSTKKKAAKDEQDPAFEAAHQARLRAVQDAQGDPARLALGAVAEYTDDPIREMRYRRVLEAWA